MNIETLDFPIEKVTSSRLSEVDFDNIAFGKTYSDHMFTADFVDGEWQNFKIEPFKNIELSPATSALHYGQAIFEGMKAYRSQSEDKVLLFRADKNFERFNLSADRICMPTIPEEIFINGLKELVSIDRNWVPNTPGCALYIRPYMFATDAYIGLKPSETYKFIIFTSPVGSYYAEPVKVKIETHYTRACEGGTGAAKFAGNYAASMYPAKLAQEQGYHQLIWTDAKEHKYIEEAGTMNLMFVLGDTLLTAPASDTILHGVTRRSIIELAREKGMKVEERPIPVQEVVDGLQNGTLKEAFGAGTAATVAHIAQINHEGTDHLLPAVENREFSNWVLGELSDLQRGVKEDNRGWIQKV